LKKLDISLSWRVFLRKFKKANSYHLLSSHLLRKFKKANSYHLLSSHLLRKFKKANSYHLFDKPVTIFSLWRYVLWIFVFCVVIAFSITQLSGEPIFNSEGFIERAQQNSVLRLSFFTSSRPFTTDFFYKIWGSNTYSVVAGQKIFAVFCWTFLGLAISSTIRNNFLAMLSLVTFSTAVLWWNVGGWANVMRSESLSCGARYDIKYVLIF